MKATRAVLALIWTAVLTACGTVDQPEITKIGIHVTLEDGSAFCEFTSDGWAEGGHVSGGAEPIVHIDRQLLPPGSVSAIWSAAGDIDTQMYPRTNAAVRECVECVELFIHYADGKVMRVSWPVDDRHPDPEVRELEALLYEYKVGGW